VKILMIAPPWESVPPGGYGGTEAVVHLLTEELAARGHSVTLFATGDSHATAHVRYVCQRSLRTAGNIVDFIPYVSRHAAEAVSLAPAFDVVHNHAGEEVMALHPLTGGVPMLTTMHCNITPDRKFVWDGYDGHYNTVSWSQRRFMPRVERPRFAGVAYNAIDVTSFPFGDKKEDHLLFLSRISVEKGAHIAIEVARRAGRRLLMAGKVDVADYAYFSSMIAPQIDGQRIIYVGEADAVKKRELYMNAAALLMPIVWEEPFGLVMAEAQACGTPVVAFGRGSAREVVKHGTTGFVVENSDQMVEAVRYTDQINPVDCRRFMEERFDVPVMANRYLELYRRIIKPETPVRARAPLPGTPIEPRTEQVALG
jgi:glycosyltransferase involved in cell wall biosynthesis